MRRGEEDRVIRPGAPPRRDERTAAAPRPRCREPSPAPDPRCAHEASFPAPDSTPSSLSPDLHAAVKDGVREVGSERGGLVHGIGRIGTQIARPDLEKKAVGLALGHASASSSRWRCSTGSQRAGKSGSFRVSAARAAEPSSFSVARTQVHGQTRRSLLLVRGRRSMATLAIRVGLATRSKRRESQSILWWVVAPIYGAPIPATGCCLSGSPSHGWDAACACRSVHAPPQSHNFICMAQQDRPLGSCIVTVRARKIQAQEGRTLTGTRQVK